MTNKDLLIHIRKLEKEVLKNIIGDINSSNIQQEISSNASAANTELIKDITKQFLNIKNEGISAELKQIHQDNEKYIISKIREKGIPNSHITKGLVNFTNLFFENYNLLISKEMGKTNTKEFTNTIMYEIQKTIIDGLKTHSMSKAEYNLIVKKEVARVTEYAYDNFIRNGKLQNAFEEILDEQEVKELIRTEIKEIIKNKTETIFSKSINEALEYNRGEIYVQIHKAIRKLKFSEDISSLEKRDVISAIESYIKNSSNKKDAKSNIIEIATTYEQQRERLRISSCGLMKSCYKNKSIDIETAYYDIDEDEIPF